MALNSKALRIACLLVVLGWAGSSQAAFYSITGGGGQAQIGNGLPLPIQNPTTMTPPTGMGAAIGTMTMFPPLLIPVNPKAPLVEQTGAAPMKMFVKPGSFKRTAVKGAPKVLGVALNNSVVFQVETNLNFTGPGPFDHIPGGAFVSTAVFFAGGRTGAKTASFGGIPAGSSKAIYSKSVAQFGGPSSTKVAQLTPPVRVWAHGFMAPCKHTKFGGPDAACVSQLLAAYPGSMAVAGGVVGGTTTTMGLPAPMSPNVAYVSVPKATGLIAASLTKVKTGAATNMATSAGFPWTTGMLTLMQLGALIGPETFVITGKDARTAGGKGTISLVSGALSARKTSGPNSNRSWARYTLPEPAAALGAAAALAMLGVCHALVRRR